jgi:hypothetical protein
MNRDERRRQKRTGGKTDAHLGEAAHGQTGTSPSSDGAEQSQQDLYRDEGGES